MALRVEHLVWGMEEMSAGLSMGQLDTLKAVLLDQVARVDEAKVGDNHLPNSAVAWWRSVGLLLLTRVLGGAFYVEGPERAAKGKARRTHALGCGGGLEFRLLMV